MEKPGYLRYKQGPVSLEAERRRAINVVFRIEQEIENFKTKWLNEASDDYIDYWLNFISMAKANANMKNCRNYRDLARELKVLKEHPALIDRRKPILQLERVADRAKIFDALIVNAKQRLKDAFEQQIAKYCLSFTYEADDQELKCVLEYENNINTWTETIKKTFVKLDRVVDELCELEGGQIEFYIENYGKVLHYMSISLDVIPEISNCLKDWVMSDEAYPRKLLDEMNRYQERKMEISEILRKRQQKTENIKSKVQRARFNSKTVSRKLQDALYERRQCRKRELAYQDEIDIIQEELDDKKFEASEIMSKFDPKKPTSVKHIQHLNSRLDTLNDEIAILEQRLKNHNKTMNTMKFYRQNIQKDVHNLKGVFEKSIRERGKISKVAVKQENSAEKLAEEQKELSEKIYALKKIRKIKTNPMIVKRIYFEGYLPGRMIDMSDHLSEALKVAAAGVGKDWIGLYQKLPFDPPRDKDKRLHDIEVIDYGIRQIEKDNKESALRGLEKWRRLSNNASTNALVRTLKSMEKHEVAQSLEKQVIVN